MMTPDIAARMEKVRKLMDSSNPGEAAAAAERYAKMQAKYCSPHSTDGTERSATYERARNHLWGQLQTLRILEEQAQRSLEQKGYAIWELNGGWYVTPADDLLSILAQGSTALELIGADANLPDVSERVS